VTGLVHDLLGDTAQRDPSKVALLADGQSYTFEALNHASDRFARGLQDAGIARGDRVAIMAESCAELVIALFGVSKAGAVFVLVNPTTKSDKLAYMLDDCAVRGLVVDGGRLAKEGEAALIHAPTVDVTVWLDAVPESVPHGLSFDALVGGDDSKLPWDPGVIDADLAAVLYTSGSTGLPKGVMLTHRNVTHNAWSIGTYLGNVPDDIVACLLPLSFNYGLFQVLVGARVGYTVMLERSFAYPFDVMRRVAEHRATALPGVPTMFATILDMPQVADLDLSSVRYLTNAGAALPPAHILRLQELFPSADMFSMYGQTECTRIAYLDPGRLAEKIDSVGKAIPNTEAYVVDDDGRRVGPGVVGELVVRGASLMRGYWGKPEETAHALRDGEIEGEKVLYTGDQFRTDDEGFLYFVGRKDDVFKCRGEKVSPKEVEFVLYELDEVAEAAVVPVPDEHDGMAVKAVVVASGRGELTEQLVRNHCRGRLEGFMVPKFVEVRDALPKTESGKILKGSLA
jgi:amino acid adenylation domain-containing protein